jgi:hypothetical protein
MPRIALALLLLSLPALAQPLGPTTQLPGFDQEQSRMVYEEGSRILRDAQQRFGPKLGIKSLTGRALVCALSQLIQGVIEAAAFQQGAGLTPAQVSGARTAIDYLRDVQAQNCDRPRGGGMGTGNEGDRLVKAFFDAHAPQARSLLETVSERLTTMFTPAAARSARDVLIAAVLVAVGIATMPLWA